MDMRSLLEDYEQNHRSTACKVSHALGIPLIALSIPMLLVSWKRAIGFFVAGWAFQFIGHALEGKRPKFFEGPEYLVAGLVWWLRLVSLPIRMLARSS